MAVPHSVEKLEEDVFDEAIIAQVACLVEYLGEEVLIRRIVHDDVRIIYVFDDSVKGDDRGMDGGYLMQRDLAKMELSAARRLA